jgi:hypothetical protein
MTVPKREIHLRLDAAHRKALPVPHACGASPQRALFDARISAGDKHAAFDLGARPRGGLHPFTLDAAT